MQQIPHAWECAYVHVAKRHLSMCTSQVMFEPYEPYAAKRIKPSQMT